MEPTCGYCDDEAAETHLYNLGQRIWLTAEEKGFHEPNDPALLERALRLLLIVSEVTELLDEMRKGGDPEKQAEELADVVIRCFHYAACEGIDLDAAVAKKMEKNKGRPYKHGKKF